MKKITKTIWKIKIIGILFLVLSFSLAPLPKEKALAWETWGSIPMGVGMTEIIAQLKIVINGAAKQAAVKMITTNVYGAVGGGGGGGAKFITNWQSALEGDPQEEAASYIESMSSNSTQMKGSSFYESADDSAMVTFEGVGADGLAQYFRSPRFVDSASAAGASASSGNYMTGLKDIVQGITSQASSSNKCPVTYTGDPNNMFADGTFKNFSEFMSGTNDPWSYQTCMQNAYEEKLAENKKEAEVKAIAYQGFEGTEQNGNVTYPGSLIKEKVANIENMGNEVIANAQGIAEVITSSVMKMGMDAMNNGIGNVQTQIQKSVTNVSTKAQSQMQNQVKNYGPGAMYGN